MILPREAEQALHLVRQELADSLVAVYLHGSAVAGGLRPSSDVDLLVVVGQPMTQALRERLVAALMTISGRPGDADTARPLELIVFHRDDLAELAYPPRSELIYGEWLREAFEAGEAPRPVSDPELTVLLAQARQEAKALFGPDPADLLPLIPRTDLRHAIRDALPALLDTLDGDERNVLLTLARMWRTLATGEIVPKDVAADWAIPRLPAKAGALVASARDAYLGIGKDDWRAHRQEARRVATYLRKIAEAML